MNDAIELHDSELLAVLREGEALVMHLNAYVHRSAGRPGIDDGVGGWQICSFVFQGAESKGQIGELPADVLTGKLQIGDETHPNMVTLPCKIEGETTRLTLFLGPDYREVAIVSAGLTIQREGEFKPTEEFRSKS